MKLRNNKGEGMTSVMLSIVIGMIILTIGAGAGIVQLSKANKSKVESDFRVIAGDIQTARNEIGVFKPIQTGETEDETSDKYLKYLKYLQQDYLHVKIGIEGTVKLTDIESLPYQERLDKELKNCVITSNGFYVLTDKKDQWGNNCKITYTEDVTVGRAFAVFSAGPNGMFESNVINTLSEKNAKKFDDIACILILKDQEDERDITFDRFI